MQPYEILTDDHPVLRQISQPVEDGEEVNEIVARMVLTMHMAGGIGLAAPQVGILKRIIILQNAGHVTHLINPIIVGAGGQRTSIEGCLSLPGRMVEIIRQRRIEVEFQEIGTGPMNMTATGMAAIIIQHEIDHLSGVLMTDHTPANQIIANLIAEQGLEAAHALVKELVK